MLFASDTASVPVEIHELLTEPATTFCSRLTVPQFPVRLLNDPRTLFFQLCRRHADRGAEFLGEKLDSALTESLMRQKNDRAEIFLSD